MQRALQNLSRAKKAVPHPRDRSVRQLEKKEKRVHRLDAQKTRLKTEQTLQLMRFFWFREQCIALGHTAAAVPEAAVAQLVQLYVERNDAEVAALKAERNPPLGRVRALEATRQQEMDALQSAKGLRVPSLADADDVEILTEIWDGAKETVSVVGVVGFSMVGKTPPTRAALDAVARRLRPVTEIREEAPVSLSKRVLKFHAAQPKKSVSVKKEDGSLATIKSRAKAREEAKRQTRLETQRRAALAGHRA